jgi:hypothetical protein
MTVRRPVACSDEGPDARLMAFDALTTSREPLPQVPDRKCCSSPVRHVVPAFVARLAGSLLNDLIQHLYQAFYLLNSVIVQQ